MTSLALTLHPRAPYDFHKSGLIFSQGDRSLRIYEDGIFSTVLDVAGTVSLVTVRSTGNVVLPELEAEFRSNGRIDKKSEDAHKLISTVLNGDIDLAEFYRVVAGDPVMASLTKKLNGLRNFLTPTVFEALVESIIEQQISLLAALSMQKNLIRDFGPRLVLGGQAYHAFPGPGILANVSPESFRACGLSSRKGEYINGVALRIIRGDLDLERLRTYSDHDKVISELRSIRGVGPWTAELTALRGLGMYSAFPAEDIGLQRIIADYYNSGQRTGTEDARRIAHNWGDWKGLAGFYLVVAGILGIRP